MDMATAVGSGLAVFMRSEIETGRKEGLVLVVGFGCVNAEVMERRDRAKSIIIDKLWCFVF